MSICKMNELSQITDYFKDKLSSFRNNKLFLQKALVFWCKLYPDDTQNDALDGSLEGLKSSILVRTDPGLLLVSLHWIMSHTLAIDINKQSENWSYSKHFQLREVFQ